MTLPNKIDKRVADLCGRLGDLNINQIMEEPILTIAKFLIAQCGNCNFRKLCWGKRYLDALGITVEFAMEKLQELIMSCPNISGTTLKWEYKWNMGDDKNGH